MLHYSPLEFGLASVVMPVTAAVGSIVGQAIATRGGLRPIATVGLALTGLGCLFLTQVSVDGSYFGDIFLGLLLFGPGLGAAYVAGSIGSLAGVRRGRRRARLGAQQLVVPDRRRVGVAILSTVAVSQADGSDPLVALTNGFQSAFATAIIFAARRAAGRYRPARQAPAPDRGSRRRTRRGVRHGARQRCALEEAAPSLAAAGPLRQTVEHHLDRGSPVGLLELVADRVDVVRRLRRRDDGLCEPSGAGERE